LRRAAAFALIRTKGRAIETTPPSPRKTNDPEDEVMTPIFFALALAAADPAAPPPADPPPAPAAVRLDEARTLYQHTCQDRAYGSYDDLCNDLKSQIAALAREADREAKLAAKAPATRTPQ
jgi:hypothetical protein